MNKTVLIVDDEQFIRDAVSEKLKKNGIAALVASDGQECLKIALEKHPDLILLDVIMAKMDGMTAMKELRKDTWGANVPIILLTQIEPDDQMLQEIVEGHPTFYLVKSKFSLDEVVDKVKERLAM